MKIKNYLSPTAKIYICFTKDVIAGSFRTNDLENDNSDNESLWEQIG